MVNIATAARSQRKDTSQRCKQLDNAEIPTPEDNTSEANSVQHTYRGKSTGTFHAVGPVDIGLANHDHDKEQQTDHDNSTININTTVAGWLDIQNQHEHDNAGNKQMAEVGITTQRG